MENHIRKYHTVYYLKKKLKNLKLILSDCKKLFGGGVSLKIVAGKLVRWRCTPQPYGLAVQRLLAFPRRTSAGSVTGHCFASPTLRQLSTITKNLREGGFLL